MLWLRWEAEGLDQNLSQVLNWGRMVQRAGLLDKKMGLGHICGSWLMVND